jgi:hypothetical protein
MSYYNSWSYTAPSGTAEVWIDATRNGVNVTVNATIKCTFRYSNDYIAYNGEINFNMWRDANNASATIKGYYDRWYATNEWSRTRTCSMTFPWYGNDMVLGFNMTVPPGNSRFSIPNTEITLDVPDYIAPGAPAWCNISPNPCAINAAPTITWGGATAGSSGRILYDVEVRSSTPTGGWTNWLRISNSQTGTSYQEIVLSGMSVNGQKPFAGVKYQYRIRVWDGVQSASGWINSPELVVGFVAPSPPTSYTLSDSSIKKDGSITITWSGASGGAGSIVRYYLDWRIYNHNTKKWTDWDRLDTTNTNYIFNMLDYYQNATNGDQLQFRISVLNSWNVPSDYLTIPAIPVRGNQMWIKINGNWVEGDTYLKVNGAWVEATPYIKVNNVWYETT